MQKYPTYHKNYENAPQDDMEFRFAVMSRTVPSIIRKGYAFTGWYAEPECKTKVEPDPYAEADYYAGWRPWTDEERERYENYISDNRSEVHNCPSRRTLGKASAVLLLRQQADIWYERFSRPLDDDADRPLADFYEGEADSSYGS